MHLRYKVTIVKGDKIWWIGHVADLGDTNFRIPSSGNCIVGGDFVRQ